MRKSLLAVLVAVVATLGTTPKELDAQLLPQQVQPSPLTQQLQQQLLRQQQVVACGTQCDSTLNSCTLNCPATIGITPSPDPRTACLSNCSQANANCHQVCTGQ